ncbi:MAG TPA: hypothetical protein VJT08_00865 [Terriglobales bacterium]|nr:hypothetical protein [Acidobacteriaceae bacterium]HKR28993.1 hypothetical protein [Terriglobales bacterium]
MNANRAMSAAYVLARFADVEVVTCDFDHWTKQRRENKQVRPISRITYLRTMRYRSNVGISRLLSHLLFSLSASWYFVRRRRRFDIVYVTLPFNTLAWGVFRSARNQLKIADVTDIWPDVLPFRREHRVALWPLFALWRRFFTGAVKRADVMMAVSDTFYEETLKYARPGCRSRRFYLGEVGLLRDMPKAETLTIAYSGNIGRLYDFETLLEVLTDLGAGSIELLIVGDGDRRDWLLTELKQRGIPHQYFGSVYDPAKLGAILCRAHLGFNGFVNTSAAFSTKASTYFAAGLPILNSMGGDLQWLVEKRRLGFNYEGGNPQSLRSHLSELDMATVKEMSENCVRFFYAELERERVRGEMLQFLRECFETRGEAVRVSDGREWQLPDS